MVNFLCCFFAVALAAAGAIRCEYLLDGGIQWLSGVAMGMLHWAMYAPLHWRISKAIEMVCDEGALSSHH